MAAPETCLAHTKLAEQRLGNKRTMRVNTLNFKKNSLALLHGNVVSHLSKFSLLSHIFSLLQISLQTVTSLIDYLIF